MPTNQRFDYELGGNGFMLVRAPSGQRAWNRTGYPDTPSRRSINDVMYGNVPDTIDHPEVWNDWSGGFGDAYEVPERPNSYHWSRGFDLRFPRQAIHAQAPRMLNVLRYSGRNINADSFLDVSSAGAAEPTGVLAIGALQFSDSGGLVPAGNLFLRPTIYQNTTASAFVPTDEDINAGAFGGNTYRPARRAVTVGSFSYIPNLSATGFIRRDFAALYTLGPSQQANWFEVAAGRMWFGFSRDKVRSVSTDADPMATANYAATLPIGRGAELKDAIALEDQLYVSNQEGAYQGNLSGTFKNVLQDIGGTADKDNCRDLTSFQAGLVAPVGPHLYWYKPSTGGNAELREIGPSGLFANRSGIRGRFTCVKGHGRWLYAGLFTGSSSWFLVGRDASPPLPYVWHPLHDFLGLTCKISRIHVDGITTSATDTPIPNRIWCATSATFGAQAGATSPIFWWPIPQGNNNPLSDLTFSPNYMGSARLDLPASEWAAPGAAKTWRVAENWAEGMASGAQYADLYYALDGATRATLGRVQASPKSLTYFPAGEGSFVAGQALALSIDSFTASINLTPVYRAHVVRGTLMPRSNDIIEARTRISDRMVDRHGGSMDPAAVQITRLRSYAAGSAPILLTDLAGANAWVKVQPPIEESEMYQQGEQEAEIMATVRMAVLEFSSGP